MPSPEVLGVLTPVGGGDPISLTKGSVIIGRRPTSDICLDFENVSGRHCELRFAKGLWHVRDLGSRNGTTVNGLKTTGEQGVLPDVELGIASHLYTIVYEPSGPIGLADALDDDLVAEPRKKASLMELAGMESDDAPKRSRPHRPPAQIERASAEVTAFDDPLEGFSAPKPIDLPSDDDFYKLIEEDVK